MIVYSVVPNFLTPDRVRPCNGSCRLPPRPARPGQRVRVTAHLAHPRDPSAVLDIDTMIPLCRLGTLTATHIEAHQLGPVSLRVVPLASDCHSLSTATHLSALCASTLSRCGPVAPSFVAPHEQHHPATQSWLPVVRHLMLSCRRASI